LVTDLGPPKDDPLPFRILELRRESGQPAYICCCF
jgi:hypothetical protein